LRRPLEDGDGDGDGDRVLIRGGEQHALQFDATETGWLVSGQKSDTLSHLLAI